MSATVRELYAPHPKPATTVAASKRTRIGIDTIQSREPLPFKFPATSSPGAEHDATIIGMINDDNSWADIEAVTGAEAFDRYYTMLDPDLEAFWDKEAMIRLNKIVWELIQSNKAGDSNSNSDLDLAATMMTTTTIVPSAADLTVLADGLPWDKIARSMDSSAAVCRHIWSTFGDGRPLSEQERVLLAMEEKRRRRRIQIEKQEQERVANEKEQARIKAEKQEQERLAKEKEQARIKAEKQEQERVAKEKEKARIKAEKQEQERVAKEKEKARIKAEKQEQARIIKAEKEKKARLAAEQAQGEREQVALEKKTAEMRLRTEARKRPVRALAESKGMKPSSASSAVVAVELAADNVASNGGDAGWSRFESDVTTRQRTRLQAQSSKIQHNKTLLEQALKLRRQADEYRQEMLSTLLSRQAACRIEYNRRIEHGNVPVSHPHAENDGRKDPVGTGKHALMGADNDTPNGGMTTASGLTCSPNLYDTQPFNRPYKRPRPKTTHPIFVPRFKEVLQQAEQQAERQRQSNLQQRKQTNPTPSTAAFVHYVYVYGVGLVRKPVSGASQASVDLTDAKERGSEANPKQQAIPAVSATVSNSRSLTATVAGASSGVVSATLPFNMPPRMNVMESPDSTSAIPNPYYDILTWSSEDIGGVWNFWVQNGDKWDYISKTVLSGRHSPQECQAFVMGAGFV